MCGIINLNENRTEITYVFALEQDTDYKRYVNNLTNNHVGTYEIHVSEDNWVYAEYGASCQYSINHPGVSQTYDSIYLTAEGLYNILKYTEKKYYGFDLGDYDYFNSIIENSDGTKLSTDVFYNNINDRWITSLNKAQEEVHSLTSIIYDAAMTNLGNGLTFAGVYITLMQGSKFAGFLITMGGGVVSGKSEIDFLLGFKSEMQRRDFVDAMYEGKCYIYVTDYSSNSIDYDATTGMIIENNDDKKMYSPWEECGYIPKYQMGVRCQIDTFNIYTLKQQENGEWVQYQN